MIPRTRLSPNGDVPRVQFWNPSTRDSNVRFCSRCGTNYGWKRLEGNRCTEYSEAEYGDCLGTARTFAVSPILEYCHVNYNSDDAGEDEYTSGIDICGDRTVLGSSVIGEYAAQQYMRLARIPTFG